MVSDPELIGGGHGVATPYDADAITGGHCFGEFFRAGGEAVYLEDAHGTVPENGLGLGDDGFELLDRYRADVDAFPVGWDGAAFGVGGDVLGLGTVFEFLGDEGVGREEELDAFFLGLFQNVEGEVELVVFYEAHAHFMSLGFAEGVGHGAADEDGVGFVEKGGDDLDFVAHFGSSHDDEERAFGVADFADEVFQFALHEEAHRALGDVVGDSFGGSMGAVGGAEGVVDENFGSAGEGFCKGGFVGGLGGVKAGVLEEENGAVGEGGTSCGCFFFNAVITESYFTAEELAQTSGDGLERVFAVHFAFGAAHVGAEDKLGSGFLEVLNGGDGGPDAGVVSDFASVIEGDVEVRTHQYFLSCRVEIANR